MGKGNFGFEAYAQEAKEMLRRGELSERYETPLPALQNEVNQWEEKVKMHLTKMGY
ncbi:MAG TPA: hypothetical protein PLG86_06930 [Bacteroidales bacterium]|nr:hypothetical protein [Bacteroidales bacterium]HPT04859.1 hypothetical protein [Bacteroidales bacterium]